MFKWLALIGVGVFMFSLVWLFTGVNAQQPFAFGLAILCGFPVAMFFLGGATFSFIANYQITPRAQDSGRVGVRSRVSRTSEIG